MTVWWTAEMVFQCHWTRVYFGFFSRDNRETSNSIDTQDRSSQAVYRSKWAVYLNHRVPNYIPDNIRRRCLRCVSRRKRFTFLLACPFPSASFSRGYTRENDLLINNRLAYATTERKRERERERERERMRLAFAATSARLKLWEITLRLIWLSDCAACKIYHV